MAPSKAIYQEKVRAFSGVPALAPKTLEEIYYTQRIKTYTSSQVSLKASQKHDEFWQPLTPADVLSAKLLLHTKKLSGIC